MKTLIAKTKINCKTGEIIFVNEQSINFLGSDYPTHVINKNECKNSTSSKCFHYLAKDYFSYFNISKSCNGKDNCALGYRDMYDSAIQFATSCGNIKGSDFDLLRIRVSNECFNCTYSFNLLHVYYFAAFPKYILIQNIIESTIRILWNICQHYIKHTVLIYIMNIKALENWKIEVWAKNYGNFKVSIQIRHDLLFKPGTFGC